MTSISKLTQRALTEAPKKQIELNPESLQKFLNGLEPKADMFRRSTPADFKGTKGVSPEYLDRLSGMLKSDKPVVPPVENTISSPPQEISKDFFRFLGGK